MDRRTKYAKVKAASPYGAYHNTFDALWGAIPSDCKEQLTAAALVELVNRLRRQWDLGAAHARQDAVDDHLFYHGGNKYRLTRELQAS